MSSNSLPRRIHLVIRNVYTPSQSLYLSVDTEMRISDLKTHLSVEFPLNPSVSSQKLIFGGKICGDHESLAQLLLQLQSSQQKERTGPDDDTKRVDPVVFHLLITSPGPRLKKNDKTKSPTIETDVVEAQDSPRFGLTDHVVLSPGLSTVDAAPPQVGNNPTPAMIQQEQNMFGQSMLMQQQAIVLYQIQYLQYLLMQQRHQQQNSFNAQVQYQPVGAHFAPAYGNFYGMMQPQMFQELLRPQEAQELSPARAHASPAAPVAPVERQNCWMIVEIAREVCSLLDSRLALKMVFMLIIIGQDMPLDRILMLGLLSLVSYMHITGIFAKIYDVYKRRRSLNGGTEPNGPAGLDAPEVAAAGGAGAAIANQFGALTRVLRISADRGFVYDVKYFVVGLLLSLVPAWHPQPIHGAAPARGEAALPDDMPIQEM